MIAAVGGYLAAKLSTKQSAPVTLAKIIEHADTDNDHNQEGAGNLQGQTCSLGTGQSEEPVESQAEQLGASLGGVPLNLLVRVNTTGNLLVYGAPLEGTTLPLVRVENHHVGGAIASHRIPWTFPWFGDFGFELHLLGGVALRWVERQRNTGEDRGLWSKLLSWFSGGREVDEEPTPGHDVSTSSSGPSDDGGAVPEGDRDLVSRPSQQDTNG